MSKIDEYQQTKKAVDASKEIVNGVWTSQPFRQENGVVVIAIHGFGSGECAERAAQAFRRALIGYSEAIQDKARSFLDEQVEDARIAAQAEVREIMADAPEVGAS